MMILLDPGHGRNTPGKKSPDGKFQEWEFNRDIAKRIHNKLTSMHILSEILHTKEDDISLTERANRANSIAKVIPSIMISIHANAAGNGDWKEAKGWEVWSTVRKNKSDQLAQCFIETFPEVFPDRKLRGHKEKNFTVIEKTNCPCVLTENFFYDNKEECNLLLTDEFRNKIVDLHVKAIVKYLNKNKVNFVPSTYDENGTNDSNSINEISE